MARVKRRRSLFVVGREGTQTFVVWVGSRTVPQGYAVKSGDATCFERQGLWNGIISLIERNNKAYRME